MRHCGAHCSMLSRYGSHIPRRPPRSAAASRGSVPREEGVQRFLLPLRSEPQRLPCFQIAHHRQELLLLPQMDLIHTHLSQCRLLREAAQRSRYRNQWPSPCFRRSRTVWHLTRRRALARLPDGVLEAFAERRLARQLLNLLDLRAAVRAPNPVQLDHYGRPELKHRKVPNFTLADLVNAVHMPPAPEQIALLLPRLRRTHSFSVFALSSISCCHTRYPGQPSSFVQSVSLKPAVYRNGVLHKHQ